MDSNFTITTLEDEFMLAVDILKIALRACEGGAFKNAVLEEEIPRFDQLVKEIKRRRS